MAIINIIAISAAFGITCSIIEHHRNEKVKAILAEAEAEGYEVVFVHEK